jgi:hypothetical protein
MSFESLTNRGEYLSAHYLAEILPTTLKGSDLFKRWTAMEKGGQDGKDGEGTPRTALRAMRRPYFDTKVELADPDFLDPERLRKHHDDLLERLGFEPAQRRVVTVERAGQEHEIPVAHAELDTAHGIVALDCGWAVDTDAAQDPDSAGRLLDPVTLPGNERILTGAKLASWLFAADNPPRYVLLLSGGVVTLADRSVWGEGRYLAVSLDTAYARNDDKELDVIAALFSADSLRPPAEGGTEPLADLVAGSRQHAVGVSGELREGLRISVELIANEVLDRIRQAGWQPQQVMELDELAKELGRESLRYLYRILFLLYAEARPELGVLPVNDPQYVQGYSLARLGDLVSRRLAPSSADRFHLYESLDLLFRMVNEGHRPRRGAEVDEQASEGEALRFEPMRSDLFLPEKTKLIGRLIPVPGSDPDDPDGPKIDTRLRNATLYQVLRRLMLTKGGKKRRGGFISYAQLGINQLGAVYEGLMSYTGFVATEHLYEVAKNGDPKDGSWMIPASKVDDYDDGVFVYKEDPYTGIRSRVSYDPGAFVYRLAGRDRQTSASYYTPQSLTEVTVQLALKYRLDQDGTTTPARELLDWTICEPALGSGAFLNEAINQVAAEYLRRRQDELGESLDPERYHLELQRVKAYIALHNCYGVDLNRTAVELAEVSLWLNVMHAGLQAPWFGLHLQRGNSLIGGGRKLYTPKQLADKSWLTTAPQERPFRDGPIDEGTIHHFLLPADGWGAVAGEKEARELAPTETAALKSWRTAMKRVPSAKGKNSQVKRLQALARRVEFLWDLVQQRLAISEREIRRDIAVWGAEDLPPVSEAVPRERILADLTAPGTPYWRLKTLMDVWCALWFWPLDKVGLLDGTDPAYPATPVEVTHVREVPAYDEPTVYEKVSLWDEVQPQQGKLPLKQTGARKVSVAEQLRQQVRLGNLDDWLTFAEALVGRADFPAESLMSQFLTLDELSVYEDSLIGPMGMTPTHQTAERFPWLPAAVDIAEQQGFFHWELTFAQAFIKGGFDLQVGNPPWVRLDWKEDVVLAECEPWFRLADRPAVEAWQARKSNALSRNSFRLTFISELVANVAQVNFLGGVTAFPLLVGTRPDLYRAFICRVWSQLGVMGCGGLVHPDTHFGGTKDGALRGAAYRHLRLHGGFINGANWAFSDASRDLEFGVHVYGAAADIDFLHLSQLYSAAAMSESLAHDGMGPVPGQKYQGSWDRRPHRSRVVRVDQDTLATWRRLRGDFNIPADQTPLLHPISTDEERAISVLASYDQRLSSVNPRISFGLDEAKSKRQGVIVWRQTIPESYEDLIVQGPHFGIANPLNKQPRVPCRSQGDWNTLDVSLISDEFIPRTNYVRAVTGEVVGRVVDLWDGVPSTQYYRLIWRAMINPKSSERSLFAALLAPGPAHVHAVHTLALSSNLETALAAGFWASLPLDYMLRITGRTNHGATEAKGMPVGSASHPLAPALLLRVLRLNCLTSAYAPLWTELYDPCWRSEGWAVGWTDISPLSSVSPTWESATALRTERDRRAALVEIDAIVAVWLGMSVDELVAVLRSRYPILTGREDQMWFDATGRKVSADPYAFGHGQSKRHFEQLIAHLEDSARNRVPEEYMAPFYKADRESEYQKAHAVFSKRLQAAIDKGWRPS